ncbi:hypothetical protein D9756_001180 [Leucocoprinus leucothites]|uniref:Protein kinase domain-containing protein n=1 Tax=Leucocoprinus leucothites TaxID=201217 RepID=A0A8H5G510_9AGAR|nr:hypothetical protein D9756_001180 [Leucoagaricus leucothites]
MVKKNVLASCGGKAMLADFGVACVLPKVATTLESSTLRWAAPELVRGDGPNRPTKESDIWAFGSLCLEIFARMEPYQEFDNTATMQAQVLSLIAQGRSPEKPDFASTHFIELTKSQKEEVHKLIWERCWEIDPKDRPTSNHIKIFIRSLNIPDRCAPIESDSDGLKEVVRKIRYKSVINYGQAYKPRLRNRDTEPGAGVEQSSQEHRASDSLSTTTGPRSLDNDRTVAGSQPRPLNNLAPNLTLPPRKVSWQVGSSSKRSPRASECLTLALGLVLHKAGFSLLRELRGDEAQHLVDFLNNVVLEEETGLDHIERKCILSLLSKIVKSAQVYPQSFELSNIECYFNEPISSGGFGDIYKGKLGGKVVCLKVPSSIRYGPRIMRMENGDLHHYLTAIPKTNPLPFILDIISGLEHLHTSDIVHSDLKAANVLVSSSHRAVLADFGLSFMSMTTVQTPQGEIGSRRWAALEKLLTGDLASPTIKSDIWAFGCVCHEILTHKKPYHELSEGQVVLALLCNRKPSDNREYCAELAEVTVKSIWRIMDWTWNSDPEKRPTATEVKAALVERKLMDDSDPIPDPDITALMQEVKGARNTYEIDYDSVSKTLLRVKSALEPAHGTPGEDT